VVSGVAAIVWVEAMTLAVIPAVVEAGVVAVVGSDIAVAVGGAGYERRGWGLGWGAVGLPGRECRRLGGDGGSFKAGDDVVVVIVNDIDSRDMAVCGCAGAVGCDAGVGGDGWGRDTVQLGGSVDIPVFLSKHGSSSYIAVCVSASTVEAGGSVDIPAFLSKRGSLS
jgi:hypothetical protein